jgi:hypothetical protein
MGLAAKTVDGRVFLQKQLFQKGPLALQRQNRSCCNGFGGKCIYLQKKVSNVLYFQKKN